MIPALAVGSTARLEGLGVIPDFVEDYGNMFTYPVSITRYPAVVVGEIGDFNAPVTWDRGFGATMGVGEDNMYGVFGIMLRENSFFSPIPYMVGAEASQFDMLWGMNFGNASFGLRFDRASSELEIVEALVLSPLALWDMMDEPTLNDLNTMGLGFSAGFNVRETDMVEATFEYRTLDFMVDDIGGDWKVEDKGEPSYGVTARGFFSMADGKTLVPMVAYAKYDGSWEIQSADPDDEDSADETITLMRAGLGYKVDVGSWFMLGLGFSQWKAEGEYDYAMATPDPDWIESYELTTSTMPFFFGCLETPVRNWLTVRFGAVKRLVKEELVVTSVGGDKIEVTTKNGVIPDEIRDGFDLNLPCFEEPFVFSMGVGFKFGDLDIDATLNQFYPFTGMYWLSGVDEVPFGRISATYHY